MADATVIVKSTDATTVVATDATGPQGPAGPAGTGVEILTTKGDLLGYSTVAARIPVGADGKVLTADSTATPGVSWQTPDVTQAELDAETTARASAVTAEATARAAADTTNATAITTEATARAAADSAHVAATDPHGDRAYTDAQLASYISTAFDFKASVRAATTANITLSGAQTIDGVSVIAGNRVLVKNQSTGSQNGIYVAASGSWTRATDADADAKVTSGLAVAVEEGTVAVGRVYVLTAANPITLGSTSLSFSLVDAGDLRAANNLSDLSSASSARSNLGVAIGTDVQAYDADLTTLASAFASATATVAAALALNEATNNGSNKVTLSAPTSIASDVTVTVPAIAASTLIAGAADGPDNSGLSLGNMGAIESNVNTVAATGSTETLDTSLYAVHDCTMDQNCTFTFSNPAPSGKCSIFTLILRGAFTPTFPAAVKWDSGSAPTYTTPSIFTFVTVDAGTNWDGARVGKAFA